jgi:pyruvate dehydrogenase E1 component beta subunit
VLHGIFSHVPGLKVVMPSTPYDAKGLMVAAVQDPNPVVYIDDRWLYGNEADVPADLYTVEIGKAAIRRTGSDVTLVAISYMASVAEIAAEKLHASGIQVEMIDMRTAKPLDLDTLFKSVEKTGRLVIADGGWRSFGWAAEVAAVTAEQLFEFLMAPIRRVTLPDCPAPASRVLEKAYYPDVETIVEAVKEVMQYSRIKH